MSFLRARLSALLGLALLYATGGAYAAPVSAPTPAFGRANILMPGEVRKLQDLNFATLAVTTGGTAVIDPNTDAMTTTGGVIHSFGTPYAALFEAVSPKNGVVIVRLPREPATLTRIGGTETMTVSDWSISGRDRRTVIAHEQFQFRVGGTLYVGANQAEGSYAGTFEVQIQFP